jgi:DNA-binding CsgD family transcriptional regulator
MDVREIRSLVAGTGDAAFAVDATETIIAWNEAAEAMFGLPAREALGRFCGDIVRGGDECGILCHANCPILEHRGRQPISNFDMLVQTANGPLWCNLSMLTVTNHDATRHVSIHILRSVEVAKRLELAMQGFLRSRTGLSVEQARQVLANGPPPVPKFGLTSRELEIWRLLAKGQAGAAIAGQLNISRVTVNNHIQHILNKLGARSRLEAVRRGEAAGLS